MIVIYSKSDLNLVGVVQDGMTVEQEIEMNVIPNFGGELEEYEAIETNKQYFHLELIDGIVTVVENEPPIPDDRPTIEEQILSETQYQTALLEMQMLGGI